jgi:hypothetical protein
MHTDGEKRLREFHELPRIEFALIRAIRVKEIRVDPCSSVVEKSYSGDGEAQYEHQ